MKNRILAVALAAALPLAAAAQGVGPPPPNRGPGPHGPGDVQAPGANGQRPRFDPARMQKRMRLARTLGLAEALDLDAPAALKLGDSLAKLDDRRLATHRTMHDSREVLRRAAQGEKVTTAEVDQAIQKALDARAQLQAIDRETVATVTQGLSPEKKARAVLFLAKFQRRFAGPHMMGPGGPGMGPGGGWRRGGRGGPAEGGMGMGPCPCPCPWAWARRPAARCSAWPVLLPAATTSTTAPRTSLTTAPRSTRPELPSAPDDVRSPGTRAGGASFWPGAREPSGARLPA